MRLSLRFIIPLLIAIAAFAYAAVPLADALMQRWFVRDLDARSSLIAAAVQDPLTRLIAAGSDPRILQYFGRMLQDERLYALGLCFGSRGVPVATSLFPRTLDCAEIEKDDGGRQLIRSGNGLYHVAIRRVDGDDDAHGWLALVHDMSFVTRRNEETRQYLFYFFIALGASIALITVVIAQISWRGWVRGLRSLLHGEGLLRPSMAATAPELRPIARDLRDLIRDLERQYRPLDGSQRIWDQQALRATLRSELHGNDVIAVSNREPYIHVRTNGGVRLQRPASGLVTALEPVMRACSGTWIAHGSGSADRETVDRKDRIAVPPEHPLYQVRRIWLSKEEEDGYYAGFANEGLWPLCHIAHVRPTFRASDFEQYRIVNRKFADAVKAEAKTPDPVVLVQDYHFALLPRMIRDRLPEATVISFWHIPWPNPEAFAICPWRAELLDGLLGSSILGFHTQFHCNNFLDTVDRMLEARVDRESFTISFRGESTSGAPLSDLDRMAAGAAREREAACRRRGARCASAWACRRATGSASASTGSTTRRGSSSASMRWPACSSTSRGGSGGSASSRSPRRRAGQSTTTATTRRACRRAPARSTTSSRTRNTRRSSSSASTTSRRPSTSTIARPTCASCRACTTG